MQIKTLLDKYAKKQKFRWATKVTDKWGSNWYNTKVDSTKVILREILKDEIIIEFDGKEYINKNGLDEFKKATKKLINKTIENLKARAISFKVYDHKGKCPHIHLFISGLAKEDKDTRQQYKQKFIESVIPELPELIKYDDSLTGEHLIAMGLQPHYKYGTIKELILDEDFGANKINTELLKSIKSKPSKKVEDTTAKFKVIFEELGSIPCYYEALTKKETDWKVRGFLVLFLKFNFGLNEEEIIAFIEQYHGWSDYDAKITKTKIKPYFTQGHKYFKLKGFPKKEVLNKNNSCINCVKCYLERDLAIKEEKKYNKVELDKVKEIFHKWVYFEDEDPIDIAFATAIGEKVEGDPIWFFLIAPPGGGKTMLLRSMQEGNTFYHLDNLTSKTFISGMMIGQGEFRKKIEDLLPQLNKKILVFKDFTTVLEKNKDERREIIGQLRSIYDGFYSHKFGTMDRKIEYESRFGLIAGVTPIIDNHWKLMQQLGERFLKYRWDEDEDLTTRKALDNEGKEIEMREELRAATNGFLQNLKIIEVKDFSHELYIEVLIELAKFIAKARTPVQIQDSRTDFYFDNVPMPERPTRLVKQLKKLAKCLAIVHKQDKVTEEEIRQIVKVGLHTIPPDRYAVLNAIAKCEATATRAYLRENVKIPESSIYRILEQLQILDLIKTTKNETWEGMTKKEYYSYALTDLAKNTLLYPLTFPKGFSKNPTCITPKKEEVSDDDLIIFVQEKGPEGYDMNEFSQKYGEDRLQALLNTGTLYRIKNGRVGVLE